MTLAPTAGYWLKESTADLIYTDEDVLARGLRTDPVFKPQWSPELFAHVDYIGPSYIIRTELLGRKDFMGLTIQHVPRVLMHRREPRVIEGRDPNQLATSTARVSVVICSRNPQMLSECLGAIRSNTVYPNYELVILSHRVEMRALCERFGAIEVPFRQDFNFARMSNLGARAASGELILFLNDDTSPVTKAWMSALAAQAVRPEVGVVGALLTYPDGRIQHAGVQIGTSNGAGHPGRLSSGIPIFPWLTHTREQLAVTGACLMMRRNAFEELQGLDESFPINYNDVDLCLRAGAAGYNVLLESNARVIHKESTTRKTGIRYGERQRFLDRWGDRIIAGDPYLNPNLTDNELLLPDPCNRMFAKR